MDTIFALSTAPGKAGVAVIRICGKGAVLALSKLNPNIPDPHKSAVRVLRADDGTLLDEALILVFPEEQSFTGDEIVEIQCHGSPAVVDAILSELSKLPAMRFAEPGEFTRRALENGRLDLSQVEGLADLIEAETEAQRRQALKVFSGDLARATEIWRKSLIRAAALVEATIDFVDEDIPLDVSPEVLALITGVRRNLQAEIEGVKTAERLRSGFEVAIVGSPNVGKSTLLNALAGREAAITSEFAGTTRDVIEVRMNLSGLPVTLLDTAGIRETSDEVENIGISRARQRAEQADIRVFLQENGSLPDLKPSSGDIVLRAKADLMSDAPDAVSGLTGQGVDNLVARITDILINRSAFIGIATRLRHGFAMQRAAQALTEAEKLLPQGEGSWDVAAEEIRTAIRALDFLVGRIDVENVLDEIFSSFCLGK